MVSIIAFVILYRLLSSFLTADLPLCVILSPIGTLLHCFHHVGTLSLVTTDSSSTMTIDFPGYTSTAVTVGNNCTSIENS